MEILEKIEDIRDLRKLNFDELKLLAYQVRKIIIETTAQRGGHLASNLGVVELTIALHYVFNTPKDKIIWDVGHQCYTHKLLTGRYKQFSTLRTLGGLSGFVKRHESEFDVFNTGHASTSISAGLGIALGRDLQKETYKVIVVIGDGGLGGGLAFEGLNHAGQVGCDLIVILNNNERAISTTVGALAKYINKLITAPTYNKLKYSLKRLIKLFPSLGISIIRVIQRIEASLKNILFGSGLFEQLGFRYIGPVDGHDLHDLITTLSRVKCVSGPILVHVYTKKGKGYKFSERHPERYHSIEAFSVQTGEPKKTPTLTYSDVFAEKVVQLCLNDERIVGITAAMPEGTGLHRLRERLGDRFFDVGIAEEHAVTLAAGMATVGLRPIVCIYSTFLQRSYDQILHDVCLQDLPVIFAVAHAGLVGEDGPTHHGVFDIAYLRHLPNIVLLAAANAQELSAMLEFALTIPHPVAIRYPKGQADICDYPLAPIELGRMQKLRSGDSGTIIALGNMVSQALLAANLIKKEGVDLAVYNARFIKPLDIELLLTSKIKDKPIFTVEEHILSSGFGTAIMEFYNEVGYNPKIIRIGLPDKFIEHGDVIKLRECYGLTAQKLAQTILKAISK